MSNDLLRRKLETEQYSMLKALLNNEEPPEGFDPERFACAAEILKLKRLKAVRRSWPYLAQLLGEDFEPHFASYQKLHSAPGYHAGLLDGRFFVRYLRRRQLIGNDRQFLIGLANFDAEYKLVGRRLFRRSGLERHFYKLVLIWCRPVIELVSMDHRQF